MILLCAAAYFIEGLHGRFTVPFFALVAIALYLIPSKKKVRCHSENHEKNSEKELLQESPLNSLAQKQVFDETSVLRANAISSAYRKDQWQKSEKTVDLLLEDCIKLIRAHLNAHTIAIFFPSIDGGLKLRKYSSPSQFINQNAIIYPGMGVIGGFLKEGLKKLNLQEIISDSSTLFYYSQDAGVRSLLASPIIAGYAERGSIIVDSTNKNNFSDEDHAFLSVVASVLGNAVFNAYLYTEHKLEHIRLAAMSSIEKEFFQNLSIDAILDKMLEVIPFTVACNRLTISVKSHKENYAEIKRTWGINTEGLENLQFSLKEKNLASLIYSKNISIFRNFSKEHYEIRYAETEPHIEEFSSFLAVPIGVDDSKGLILLESVTRNAFGESDKDLLVRLALSAGLAIEKILILDQARNLATHDGLTGLNNHREFQQILSDEITRAIRYQDSLSLIICDIDFFKKINDTYGHQFGDTVLKGVASCLESCIRQGVDTVARYGGEEFALILVKSDVGNAVETAERIRQQISSKLFKAPTGEDVHITMSFGIAVYRQHARQIDELIKRADKALYRAKDNGRNRVEVF
jgi:diguanylate cyclase (GGDEF)-like protein